MEEIRNLLKKREEYLLKLKYETGKNPIHQKMIIRMIERYFK